MVLVLSYWKREIHVWELIGDEDERSGIEDQMTVSRHAMHFDLDTLEKQPEVRL